MFHCGDRGNLILLYAFIKIVLVHDKREYGMNEKVIMTVVKLGCVASVALLRIM